MAPKPKRRSSSSSSSSDVSIVTESSSHSPPVVEEVKKVPKTVASPGKKKTIEPSEEEYSSFSAEEPSKTTPKTNQSFRPSKAERGDPVPPSRPPPVPAAEDKGNPEKMVVVLGRGASSWFYLFEISEDGVRGNTQLLSAVLFCMMFIIFLLAEIVNWAADIRYSTLVPFVFLVFISMTISRLLYQQFGRFTILPMFINLAPAFWLLVCSREAHKFIAFFFLSCSLVIYIMSGSVNLRTPFIVYSLFFTAMYAGAVAIIEWFFVDTGGTDYQRGAVLNDPIVWSEEATLIVCFIFLCLAFIPTVRYIQLYAASMSHMVKRVKALESKSFGPVNVKTPIGRVIALLKDIQKYPANLDDRLSEVIQIVSQGELYKPALVSGTTDDNLVEAWLKETIEHGVAKATGSSLRLGVSSTALAPNAAAATRTADNSTYNIFKELKIDFDPLDIMDAIDEWDFDVFVLNEKTDGHPLVSMGHTLFIKYGFFEKFGIDRRKLGEFLLTIEKGYMASNPYHNCLHGADVAQTLHYFIEKTALKDTLSDLEKMAAIVSALCHDFEHPGVNNNFLINTSSPLAIRYSDRSVLESHHLAASFTVLMTESCDFLANLTAAEKKTFRKIMVTMVLATDMAHHFERLGLFEGKLAAGRQAFDLNDEANKMLTMELAIKSADISNPAKAQELCTEWAFRVAEEFYRQGDTEAEKNMPKSMFCDRAKNTDFPKSQVGFSDFFVRPLYGHFIKLFPELSHINDQILANRTMWEGYVGKLPGGDAV